MTHSLNRRTLVAGVAIAGLAVLSGCQFRPLYGSGATGPGLTGIAVAEVDTREAQQVRNHLIFMLTGGSTPADPAKEVRLRIASTTQTLASTISDDDSLQLGNTAGTITITASYEIYDFATRTVTHRGTRNATANYSRTSQSFANSRAERDAQNRAAREVAERLRLAIASDLESV